MEDQKLNPEESMQIINLIIDRAQNKLNENGFLFIFWGWLVFAVALSFYILVNLKIENSWLVWYAMPAGGLFTMIYIFKKQKTEKVKSFVDDYLSYIGIGFGISLTIVLVMGYKLQLGCYPIVIMLYALTTFIYGGIFKFMPLAICGALSFPICIGAFFVDFHTQILLLALSVLISYIIPGHMLQYKFKGQALNV